MVPVAPPNPRPPLANPPARPALHSVTATAERHQQQRQPGLERNTCTSTRARHRGAYTIHPLPAPRPYLPYPPSM
ncbi:hypothetical protein E2C01_018389 [Portunus trituberculatus]|uniref:Uncharacterized protein n=1 Tax=Portunus trituberculatus TaxID=210409 RepID=A0A5B7DUD0_PORTR|nr:hypothetical protein [Portunus trituberculatus]